MRAVTRLMGVSINTVSKLLRDAGNACAAYHDEHVRGIAGQRPIQCDEIWSFVYAKQKNVAASKSPPPGAGTVWTWTGLDASSKLMVSYLLADSRETAAAVAFFEDLAGRLEEKPVLLTDSLASYAEAAWLVFGGKTEHIMGKSGTTFVERQNLTMRMGMRRFARKTNAYSKRMEYLAAAISLHYIHYNFCRIHSTIRCTPAMAAGIDPHLHDLDWIVGLIE